VTDDKPLFAERVLSIWNSLPYDVELGEFRRLLKTFLFTWDIGA